MGSFKFQPFSVSLLFLGLLLFLGFGHLAVLHVSWIQISNTVLLCCQCTQLGGD
jgi:hypothetical protein